MAKPIATVSAVFAACDRLDANKDRWNREDVRHEVGGGGYVVIDPLIRAWRALKPVREAAPHTPAELLHQVATSIDAHVTELTDRVDARLVDSQAVFESTVSTLSENLAAMEAELTEKLAALEEALVANESLSDKLGQQKDDLNAAREDNARIVAENDGLRGQVARMVQEHKASVTALQVDAKALAEQHVLAQARLSEEHANALANQRRELTEAAEHAENRWMTLLDQARQEAKVTESKLSGSLEEATQQLQLRRESVVKLEINLAEMSRENKKLDAELSAQRENNTNLRQVIEDQKAATATIAQEFSDYKKQHALGGELGALQAAVTDLQSRLAGRAEDAQ